MPSALTNASDLDPLELAGVLLSSWRGVPDREALAAFLDGVRTANLSALEREEFAIASMGLGTAGDFCTVPWVPLTIRALDVVDGGVALYGTPQTYGGGLIYGQPSQPRYRWAVDAAWVGFDYIADRIYRPTAIFDEGAAKLTVGDATSGAGGSIAFVQSPFDSLPGTLVTGAAGQDRELTLWARNVQVDLRGLYYRFGSALGLGGTSGPTYRAAVTELTRALQKTFTLDGLRRGISQAAGVPVALATETVERVDTLSVGVVVSTDQNIYRYPVGSTPIVSARTQLTPGDALVDTVQIYDMSSAGAVTPPIPAMLLGGIRGVAGALAFPNRAGVWQFRYVGGVPTVRCEVIGSTVDVEAFWASVHTSGLASTTLAARLGISVPAGVSSVNPMEFIIQQVLGPNLVVIVVKPQFFSSPSGNFYAHLPALLPSWTRYLFHQDAGTAPLDLYATSATSEVVSAFPMTAPPVALVGSGGDAALLDFVPSLTLT